MKRWQGIWWLALLIGAVALSAPAGCTDPVAWTPEAKLLAARDTFTATVNVLTTAIDAGQFSDKEAQEILLIAQVGQRLLDSYDAALELGQPTSELLGQLNIVLRELVAWKHAGERKVSDGSG